MSLERDTWSNVLSLASAGDRQVQLSLDRDRHSNHPGFSKKHGIMQL
jgi:hypothetical protein